MASEKAAEGSWVQIYRVILPAGGRAPQVPPDTQAVALEMRVRGILTHPATAGEEAEILTAAGRRVRGILVDPNPRYTHDYGQPVDVLIAAGIEMLDLRAGAGGTK